jgi:hypothetical protein
VLWRLNELTPIHAASGIDNLVDSLNIFVIFFFFFLKILYCTCTYVRTNHRKDNLRRTNLPAKTNRAISMPNLVCTEDRVSQVLSAYIQFLFFFETASDKYCVKVVSSVFKFGSFHRSKFFCLIESVQVLFKCSSLLNVLKVIIIFIVVFLLLSLSMII